MSRCPIPLACSSTHATKRIEKASHLLGRSTVCRLLGYALFLLGAKRDEIAAYLDLPLGTLLSLLTRIDQYGLAALHDRRTSTPGPPRIQEAPVTVSLIKSDQHISIQLGRHLPAIDIPIGNVLQSRVVLLTLLENGLLPAKEVAEVLDLSTKHVNDLKGKLRTEDVASLTDQRKGQPRDYRFTLDVKVELIQQFAAHALTGHPTSSRLLTERINERRQWSLSDRSVRWHLRKLGLAQIQKSLPALVEAVKKTPRADSAPSP